MFIRDKHNTVENTVRQVRTSLNLTQEELALRADATRQTIISIEKGNYVPSLELAFAFSVAFEVPVEKIFWISEVS